MHLKSFLLFSLGIAALFSVVPLATWLATGRLRDALWAARQYGWIMLWLIGVPVLVGSVLAVVFRFLGIDPT